MPRQEPGISLRGVPVQVHFVIEPPLIAGVNLIVMASPTLPSTSITPVVALTASDETYCVEVNELSQESRLLAPADWTISVTHVRAELAANTASEAFALFV